MNHTIEFFAYFLLFALCFWCVGCVPIEPEIKPDRIQHPFDVCLNNSEITRCKVSVEIER